MNELILHHYPSSPFSEKIRLILGYKGLTWRSVMVPPIMPKPDVVALTGGYRRTPFLQVGRDIYCDTMLMCQVIEAAAPEPSLYPASAAGTASMLAHWADTQLFWSAIPYTMQPAGLASIFEGAPPEAIKAFAADRGSFAPNLKRPTPADATAQLQTFLGWLGAHLADGRRFMCGNEPSIADFSVAQCLWYVRRAPPVAGVLDAHALVLAWHDRVLAFGHGEAIRMTSAQALEVAATCMHFADTHVEPGQGLEPGAIVTVCATDYGSDPVQGELVGLTAQSVAVRRHDERAGAVTVHFPRIGFQVRKFKPEAAR